jgi:transcriptional regulator PpsR
MSVWAHSDRFAMSFQRNLLGALDAAAAGKVIAASADVAMVLDREGVIRDMAVSAPELSREGVEAWLDKHWSDTVTQESRLKVEELLQEAAADAAPRWREVNHPSPRGDSISVRYVAVRAGSVGHTVLMGRDNRLATTLQQKLLQAQQSMERDYARLRDAESRYRLLFRLASEAVLIVDSGSRRVVEVNPAADRLIGGDGALAGRPFARLFAVQSQEAAAALLSVAQSAAAPSGSQARLMSNGREYAVSASLFRLDRTAHFLIRLVPAERGEASLPEGRQKLLEALDRMPDAFVVTDADLGILAMNPAFLDLVRIPTQEQAIGRSLETYLGRPGIDRPVLMETLRTHGAARNFNTIIRTQFLDTEDVEVSAVAASDNGQPFYGFSIRGVSRRDAATAASPLSFPRSAADMSELVGRASLKEIVRDTTDLVERLCIEAALQLTGDNRASAAELLGLSRQSLYSKLHRFGMGNFDSEPA